MRRSYDLLPTKFPTCVTIHWTFIGSFYSSRICFTFLLVLLRYNRLKTYATAVIFKIVKNEIHAKAKLALFVALGIIIVPFALSMLKLDFKLVKNIEISFLYKTSVFNIYSNKIYLIGLNLTKMSYFHAS